MKNEVKYSEIDNNKHVENLSLQKFVKLFINHKSPYGLTREYIFSELEPVFENGEMSRDDFIDLLKNFGEQFSEEEINNYLNILMNEGMIQDILPEKISIDFIMENILGFETVN